LTTTDYRRIKILLSKDPKIDDLVPNGDYTMLVLQSPLNKPTNISGR
jgi:hypothetical protein